MISAPLWQTKLFGMAAALAILLEVTVQPSLNLQLLLLAPLVAILGLPHGALDLPIAEVLWPLKGWRGKLGFLAVYLALAAAVIVLWIVLPGVALAAFLAYSVLHFSDDWADATSPLKWTGGMATIGAPALFHPEEVAALFAQLSAPAAAQVTTHLAVFAGALALGVFIATCIVRPEARGQAAVEQAMLWGIAALLPPLLFFAVYFCGLHSLRHFTVTIQSVPRARRALAISALLSGLVVFVAVMFQFSQPTSDLGETSKLSMQTIFIGLAALTVPHMLLVERFGRLRKHLL